MELGNRTFAGEKYAEKTVKNKKTHKRNLTGRAVLWGFALCMAKHEPLPKNKIFCKRGNDNPLPLLHLCIVIKVTSVLPVVCEVSMSTHLNNGESVVSLREEPNSSVAQRGQQFTSTITFAWHVHVAVQKLPSNAWRVQMTIQAEGSISRSFISNPVDVQLNAPAVAEFPSPNVPPTSDNFWAERLEAGPHNRKGNEAQQHNPMLPTVHFRLLPDSTGTKAERLLIENTSMAIFWIIGARNIVLIEVDNISA